MYLPSDPSSSTSPFPFSVLSTEAVCVTWRTQKVGGGPQLTGKSHCTPVASIPPGLDPRGRGCCVLPSQVITGLSALGPFHLGRLLKCSAWAVFTVVWYSVPRRHSNPFIGLTSIDCLQSFTVSCSPHPQEGHTYPTFLPFCLPAYPIFSESLGLCVKEILVIII